MRRGPVLAFVVAAVFIGCAPPPAEGEGEEGEGEEGEGEGEEGEGEEGEGEGCDVDGDGDGDGVDCPDDCDDTRRDLRARADDADCDGTATAADCDDDDPARPADNDRDCDDVVATDDCDDNDDGAGSRADDADCDGVDAALDCDDDDDALGSVADDADCDGATNAVEIACGTSPTTPSALAADLDEDGVCDRVDDDKDGDGADFRADCNDRNALVAPGVAEVARDGVDNNCDSVADDDIIEVAALATGGLVRAVVVSDDRVFVGRDAGIDVYDRATFQRLRSVAVPQLTALVRIDDVLYVTTTPAFFTEVVPLDIDTLEPVGPGYDAFGTTLTVSGGVLLDGLCRARFHLDAAGAIVGATPFFDDRASFACAVDGDAIYAVSATQLLKMNHDGVAAGAAFVFASSALRAVVAHDGVAFVDDTGLAAFDMSGNTPVALGRLGFVPSVAASTFVDDTTLLVFGSAAGFNGDSVFVDVAAPGTLVELGRSVGPLNNGPAAIDGGDVIATTGTGDLVRAPYDIDSVGPVAVVGRVSLRANGVVLDAGRARLFGVDSLVIEGSTLDVAQSGLGGPLERGTIHAGTFAQPRFLDTRERRVLSSGQNSLSLVVDLNVGAVARAPFNDNSAGGVVVGDGAFFAVRRGNGSAMLTVDVSVDPPALLAEATAAERFLQFTVVNGLPVAIVDVSGTRTIVAYPNRTATSLGARVVIPSDANDGEPQLLGSRDNVLFSLTTARVRAQVLDDARAPGPVTKDSLPCSSPQALTVAADRVYVSGFQCFGAYTSTSTDLALVAAVDVGSSFTSAVAVDDDLIGIVDDGVARFFRDTTR
jgi:hypothetical protein